MNQSLTRFIEQSDLDAVYQRVCMSLSGHGFGVLTEIDVTATVKEKLGIDMEPCRILGACNPWLAHAFLSREPRTGVLLPCNVVLRRRDGGIEIHAFDPVPSVEAYDNNELNLLAGEVRELLRRVVEDA